MFDLTRQEQKLVAFLIAALLIGAAVKYYRMTRAQAVPVVEQVK